MEKHFNLYHSIKSTTMMRQLRLIKRSIPLVIGCIAWALVSASAQTAALKGTVTSTDGQPFPGVTVRVTGTSGGTVTDAKGTYHLVNVPSGATVSCSSRAFSLRCAR